jgi:hypothetical protein
MGKFKTLQEAATKILAAGKFKAASTMNGWKKGDIVLISNAFVSNPYVQVVRMDTGGAYNLTLAQIDTYVDSRADLEEEGKKLVEALDINKAKLKYLDETKQDIFDETEFKVWNTLQLLKGKKNDLDKAKAIAALINS